MSQELELFKNKTKLFREKLLDLPREDLLEIIAMQDDKLISGINRIEYVFENKLRHLTWPDGSPINGREMTKEELALLVDEPFEFDEDLAQLGLTLEQQRQVHYAKDPVLWARHYLDARPRVYQILILRDPSLRKVLRAGRRLGKTFSMAIALMHYSYTTQYGRCIVVTPMKSQAGLIYEEIMKLAKKNETILSSISRNVTSPQYEIEFRNGSTIRFFTSGMRCLTPDHDVLTDSGWKPISEVVIGENIVTWSNGNYELAPVQDTHTYSYDGFLMSHNGQQVSFRTTPNHKFVAKTRNPNSQWKDVRADELKDYYIPTGANEVGTSQCNFSKDELELWGWWISEGSGFINGKARISQKKEYGLNRIQDLIIAVGHDYTVYQYGDKGAEIRTTWTPPIFSGTCSYDKFIPRELFYEDHRESLLKGLLGGDGWIRKNGWEYSSSSFQLINDVQELAVLMGLRANLREKKITYTPVDRGEPNRHWIVSGYDYRESLLQKGGPQKELYSGKVHCVTVPSGYFLTRHNGLVHVTGNSGGKADVTRGQEAHMIVLDELDYMNPEDLDALYAMLMTTDEGQPDKTLIGASTPTGRREVFWNWCVNSDKFKEFYFPSYCNPYFDRDQEEEFREQYHEMAYRHEIEADWGEDAEGVYPRKYVDLSFKDPGWEYIPDVRSARSFFTIGVDWDKYGAGTNIVVLEICNEDYEEARFANKLRVAYREETRKDEYSLTKAVNRVVELNAIFNPRHIYVDRGFGEVQVELLHKYGLEHPDTGLTSKVKGISFASNVEVRDPFTFEKVKKEIKPFMVDNLRQFLEKEDIIFPREDEELYHQLISYVVVRTTQTGRPVFEAAGSAADHAHDALLLACHAVVENYNELLKVRHARMSVSVSNETFLPLMTLSGDPATRKVESDIIKENWGGEGNAPIVRKRPLSYGGMRAGKRSINRPSF